MTDMETHGYLSVLRPPRSSASPGSLLEREDLDEDLVTRLRAIRDLALELAREAGRGGTQPGSPNAP